MNIGSLEQFLFDPTLGKIVAALVGIVAIEVILNVLRKVVERRLEDINNRFRVRQVLSIASYVLIIIYLTLVFNQRLGNLTVAFGVAGAGIAFALQEVIASAAGWFAISFADFYKVGDRVELGGIQGDVIDIGILRTTLMEMGAWVNGDLYNGRIVRVANSFVFKSPVFNYSGDFPFLWDEITIPVKYGSDYRQARQIMLKVADDILGDFTRMANARWRKVTRKYLIEDARVEPMVSMVANDNWMAFTLRYVVDYKKRRSTQDELFVSILEAFDHTGGRIAIASTTLKLVDMPSLQVHMGDGTLSRVRS